MWLTNPTDPAHPYFETSEDAYELLWKLRGWEPCDPPPLEDDAEPEQLLDDQPVIDHAGLIEEPALDVDDDPLPDPEAAPSGDTKE